MEFAVMSLVGPGETEMERLRRMLHSIFSYTSKVKEVVLIDDVLSPRPLAGVYPFPAGVKCTVLTNERLGDGQGILGGACTGLLQALRHLATHSQAQAVMKIDTDALVIAPFEEKVEQLLGREPLLGTAGVVEVNCDGSPRNWEPFSSVTRQLAMFVRWKRYTLLPRRIALWGRWRVLRQALLAARRHGYAWGEHSQGGSYLVSRLLVERMRERGYLEHGQHWRHIYMCEDPMMGLYARACGLKNVHAGAAGEIFGVTHQGLPLTPQELIERGYAIVHSVKNDARFSEKEVVELFESRYSTPGTVPAA